jgi:hypothetical protein
MCSIVLPSQEKVSRSVARENVKSSIREAKKLNKALRNGTWKSSGNVDIVAPSTTSQQ